MNASSQLLSRLASAMAIIFLCLGLASCGSNDGSDGAAGAQGPQGPEGPQGPAGPPGTGLEAVAAAEPEACATCHGGVGGEHQAIYDRYVDGSALDMTFNSVSSVADGSGTFTVTLNFSITQDGQPFVDAAKLPSLDQRSFYAVQYNSTTGEYLNSKSMSANNIVPGGAAGNYVLTQTGVPFAPESPAAPFDGSQVYGYIADGALFEHDSPSSELPAGSHVHLYDDVSNAALAFGTARVSDAGVYLSAANVSGCQKCHGTPYLKHGYRAAEVAGLPDFAGCKSCHYDDRNGGHPDWQYMVDDPLNWATAGLAGTDVSNKYAYKANIMNDVHMSHAMEFPYPQSMSNCVTCHEGKLNQVLANSNFTLETCKSCHPVDGVNAWPADAGDVAEGDYAQPHRAPPLEYLWTKEGVEFHDPVGTFNCQNCHGAGLARNFMQLHSGYDDHIYTATGQKYSDLYTASIEDVSVAGDLMTVEFSTSDPAIEPEVLISFYGWDSKNFIVPSHARDSNPACPSSRGAGCQYEFGPGDNSPLFPGFEEVASGNFVLTADLSAWQGQPDSISNLIAAGIVHKAEISITPQLELNVGGEPTDVVLTGVSATIDLASNALVDGYFKGANATVDTAKCNVCHDTLASTFHDGSGRGGDGIQICKNCHNPTFAGSHLEMASRSIDSYVHAIHSFQDFDVGDIFEEFDPVLAARYEQHTTHTFPNFTIRNCEACHLEGVYDVPDQTRSMPGLLSASDTVNTWYTMEAGIPVENTDGRNIGSVPEYVTGPASRACGGCHRADLINADLAGDLASFNAHTKMGGTLVENDDDDTVLFGVIDKIMMMFE